MSKYLMVDIGAGTMDVLHFDDELGVHYYAVAKSAFLPVAETAASLSGDLFVTGCEMGGGPITRVLTERTCEAEVVMTAAAAMTIHHDLDRVRATGIHVIDDQEAQSVSLRADHAKLDIADLDLDRLKWLVDGFGVPFAFDVIGLCAQDHGTPPPGVSHLDYRHNLFKARLDDTPVPQALLFAGDQVPATFNRLGDMNQLFTLKELVHGNVDQAGRFPDPGFGHHYTQLPRPRPGEEEVSSTLTTLRFLRSFIFFPLSSFQPVLF